MKQLTAISGCLLILTVVLAAPMALAAEKDESKSKERVVNINEATVSQLSLLPRVGPSLSARIIEFRDENGKFEQAADLMLVRGIGEKTFALMEPYVAVEGKTTLTEKLKASQLQPKEDSKKSTE